MNRTIRLIHKAFILASAAVLFASLVFYLIKWNSLPEKAGVHFGPDCQFDVYGSKFYGFYPHLVGAAFTAGSALAVRLAGRLKTGLRIDESGERLIKNELCITLDVIMFLQAAFFTHWSLCVSLQQPLNQIIAGNIALVIFGVGLAGFIVQTATYFIKKKDKTSAP